jgi:hypothetical protein
LVSVGGDLPGVLAVGQQATGIFAIGQEAKGVVAIGQLATGVLAIGQLATGVVAIGQLARGFIAVGQISLGIVSGGMVSFGVLWCAGAGVGGFGGPGLVYGLFPRPHWRRILAWTRDEPWDAATRRPAWRMALSTALLAVLGALWWFVAGQALIAAVSG